jgi:hypothetical protein
MQLYKVRSSRDYMKMKQKLNHRLFHFQLRIRFRAYYNIVHVKNKLFSLQRTFTRLLKLKPITMALQLPRSILIYSVGTKQNGNAISNILHVCKCLQRAAFNLPATGNHMKHH